jgi:hypothetical protein
MQFTDNEIRFDHEPGAQVSGFTVPEKFLDMDHEARQGLIWDQLNTHFTPDEQQQVS